jgi:hypothetical protein
MDLENDYDCDQWIQITIGDYESILCNSWGSWQVQLISTGEILFWQMSVNVSECLSKLSNTHKLPCLLPNIVLTLNTKSLWSET